MCLQVRCIRLWYGTLADVTFHGMINLMKTLLFTTLPTEWTKFLNVFVPFYPPRLASLFLPLSLFILILPPSFAPDVRPEGKGASGKAKSEYWEMWFVNYGRNSVELCITILAVGQPLASEPEESPIEDKASPLARPRLDSAGTPAR